ncbi:type IV pilin N-terminal domain-containing protein [uncultured Methanospirillum sp.]|uniref:type IV pilin N-terminal domain-containing protein n=1 Tax=uncultured Methanospirillum sp. TaxID=262503 RepID=UPI0029C880A7|nr:type IV pilin N-terminal domain-containing protein [uncultured Methanospirillum sp.]
MKHSLNLKEQAVSPVIGILLMLVVTIIIAAVVSGFAGGLVGNQQKTPQASIVATSFDVKGAVDTAPTSTNGSSGFPVPTNAGTAADIYVTFESKGGDSFNLGNIEMKLSSLQKPNEKSTVSNAKSPLANPWDGGTIGDKSLISGFSKSWSKYLERLPDKQSIIKPGDKFVMHADYAAQDADGVKSVCWLYEGGLFPFVINEGDVLTYQIIDKPTGKVISSGQINVPEFSVTTS